jgi:Na+-driven multidrug efflux pump
LFQDSQIDTISKFYGEYYDKVRQFASQYIYIMGVGCIFALYSQFISLLVIAEGRQAIVVVAAILCNGINILLDWVLIKYGKLTMMGGAIATDIGWLLNTIICFSYIIYLGRNNDTNLHMKALRKINFKVRDYSELFALGLPSFVRNLSMAIATTIQVSLLVAVVNAAYSPHLGISEYQSVYGAVNAIANLFWTALFGIINGARIICSYNYGARNFKRVRGSY